MDLPPSGWYPDPYGVPGLLRWWDGAAWTGHTYSEAALPGAEPTTVESAATAVGPARTALEPAVTRVEPAATSVDPAVLTSTQPPSGPPTSPQPAIPVDYAHGTQVMPMDGSGFAGGSGYSGDTGWAGHMTWHGPGASGGRYSQFRGDARHRQTLMAVGLTAAAAASFAVIAVVISNMNASGPPPAATNLPTAPATVAASPSSEATTPAANPSATPSAMATVTDTTTGLMYQQLPAPWTAGCPGTLNSQTFAWTAGESASAGTINNGQTTWYGEACSGPLPAQYGYNGTADLQNVANNLVNQFNGAYYGALPHNFAESGNQPVAPNGHPGWEITFTQTYTSPQPGQAFTTEAGAVEVIDPGTGATPEVFFVSVPSNLNEAYVSTFVASLQMPSPPQPTASANPTTPAPGDQNGGQGGGGGN